MNTNYKIGDKVVTDVGEVEIYDVLTVGGEADGKIEIYEVVHADGHHEVAVSDNASVWVLGDEDDRRHNHEQWTVVDDVCGVDWIDDVVDAELREWINDRADDYAKADDEMAGSDDGYGYGVQMADDCTDNDMSHDEAHDYAVAHGGGTVIREDVLTHEVKAMETVEAAKDLADYKSDEDDEDTDYQWAVVVIKSGEPMVKIGEDVSNYKRITYHHDDLREALEYRRGRRNYLQDDGVAELVVVRNYDTIVDWVD